MKLYPRQSQCPHCKTVYRYADVKRLAAEKEGRCYHCGKKLRVSKKSLIWLAAELIMIYAAMNAIAIGAAHTVTLLPLFIMNLVPAVVGVAVYPLYLEVVASD